MALLLDLALNLLLLLLFKIVILFFYCYLFFSIREDIPWKSSLSSDDGDSRSRIEGLDSTQFDNKYCAYLKNEVSKQVVGSEQLERRYEQARQPPLVRQAVLAADQSSVSSQSNNNVLCGESRNIISYGESRYSQAPCSNEYGSTAIFSHSSGNLTEHIHMDPKKSEDFDKSNVKNCYMTLNQQQWHDVKDNSHMQTSNRGRMTGNDLVNQQLNDNSHIQASSRSRMTSNDLVNQQLNDNSHMQALSRVRSTMPITSSDLVPPMSGKSQPAEVGRNLSKFDSAAKFDSTAIDKVNISLSDNNQTTTIANKERNSSGFINQSTRDCKQLHDSLTNESFAINDTMERNEDQIKNTVITNNFNLSKVNNEYEKRTLSSESDRNKHTSQDNDRLKPDDNKSNKTSVRKDRNKYSADRSIDKNRRHVGPGDNIEDKVGSSEDCTKERKDSNKRHGVDEIVGEKTDSNKRHGGNEDIVGERKDNSRCHGVDDGVGERKDNSRRHGFDDGVGERKDNSRRHGVDDGVGERKDNNRRLGVNDIVGERKDGNKRHVVDDVVGERKDSNRRLGSNDNIVGERKDSNRRHGCNSEIVGERNNSNRRHDGNDDVERKDSNRRHGGYEEIVGERRDSNRRHGGNEEIVGERRDSNRRHGCNDDILEERKDSNRRYGGNDDIVVEKKIDKRDVQSNTSKQAAGSENAVAKDGVSGELPMDNWSSVNTTLHNKTDDIKKIEKKRSRRSKRSDKNKMVVSEERQKMPESKHTRLSSEEKMLTSGGLSNNKYSSKGAADLAKGTDSDIRKKMAVNSGLSGITTQQERTVNRKNKQSMREAEMNNRLMWPHSLEFVRGGGGVSRSARQMSWSDDCGDYDDWDCELFAGRRVGGGGAPRYRGAAVSDRGAAVSDRPSREWATAHGRNQPAAHYGHGAGGGRSTNSRTADVSESSNLSRGGRVTGVGRGRDNFNMSNSELQPRPRTSQSSNTVEYNDALKRELPPRKKRSRRRRNKGGNFLFFAFSYH